MILVVLILLALIVTIVAAYLARKNKMIMFGVIGLALFGIICFVALFLLGLQNM